MEIPQQHRGFCLERPMGAGGKKGANGVQGQGIRWITTGKLSKRCHSSRQFIVVQLICELLGGFFKPDIGNQVSAPVKTHHIGSRIHIENKMLGLTFNPNLMLVRCSLRVNPDLHGQRKDSLTLHERLYLLDFHLKLLSCRHICGVNLKYRMPSSPYPLVEKPGQVLPCRLFECSEQIAAFNTGELILVLEVPKALEEFLISKYPAKHMENNGALLIRGLRVVDLVT